MPIKKVIGVMLAAASLLLIPLVAMQLTDEVAWTLSDFVVIWVLLVAAGLSYLFATRNATTTKQRFVTGAIVALAVLYIWAELAVGVFTNIGS